MKRITENRELALNGQKSAISRMLGNKINYSLMYATAFLCVVFFVFAAVPAGAKIKEPRPQIQAGGAHTVAIESDGMLWAWGENAAGQLGDGTNTDKNTPTQIGTDNTWVFITAGGQHSVALKSAGTLWAWGDNTAGQLGDGSNTASDVPIQIGSGTTWVSVSAGSNHTIARKSDGTLWAWGDNTAGQLGDGSNTASNVPIQIGSATNWISVSAGGAHTVAVKAGRTLWAWGDNTAGQLGDGTNTDTNTPAQITIDIGMDNKWTFISAGYVHTAALNFDGTLWTWGWNSAGQLGDGTNIDRHAPVKIGTDNTWVSVSAGGYHTAAIKSDGTLWAWGYNYDGELGDGTWDDKNSPVQIGSDTDWVSVSAGFVHTVALKSDGTLWTWGLNNKGQLGDGTWDDKNTPVQIGTDTDWVSVSAGGFIVQLTDYTYKTTGHTVALKSDGELWAWGSNDYGQLGGTGLGYPSQPTPAHIGSDNDWVSISAGQNHTAALKSDGTLWTWGQNQYSYLGPGGIVVEEYGQLGDGTWTNKSEPTQVGSETSWVHVSAGGIHTTALKADGGLWTWGFNDFGELGDGTNVKKNTPTHIGTATDWISVAGGGYYTVALKSDGMIWSFGRNYAGELGDGTTTSRNAPTLSVTAPLADFSSDNQTGTAPKTINFTDVSANVPTSWSWTFGDGGTSTTQNPSHTYWDGGTFNVSLTATNVGGNGTKTVNGYITLSCPTGVAKLPGSQPVYSSFQDIYSNYATSGSTILMKTGAVSETPTLDRNISVTIIGGYGLDLNSCLTTVSGISTFSGAITNSSGTSTLENIGGSSLTVSGGSVIAKYIVIQ